jgi:4'-phosphopantetheinyl transferase
MKPANVMWPPAPDSLKPVAGVVNVFGATLDVSAERRETLAQSLSPDEWQRAKRFHLARDRDRFIAGRGTLRVILATQLDCPSDRLVFAYGKFGKPQIATPTTPHSLHFNLAHSDSLAVYAIAHDELGVDVERIRVLNDAEEIAARFFSAREKSRLLALPPERRPEAFFNCWTCKEAYLKAIGTGLHDQLEQVEVSLSPGETAELRDCSKPSQSWRLQTLMPAVGFVGALVTKLAEPQVNCWWWDGPAMPA